MDTVRAARIAVAAFCGGLAVLEVATLLTALSWLRWWEHPGWVGLWAVRSVGYALAAWWLARGERRGVWLAGALLASVLALYALPFVDHAENQYHRRVGSALGLVLLGFSARRRDPHG